MVDGKNIASAASVIHIHYIIVNILRNLCLLVVLIFLFWGPVKNRAVGGSTEQCFFEV